MGAADSAVRGSGDWEGFGTTVCQKLPRSRTKGDSWSFHSCTGFCSEESMVGMGWETGCCAMGWRRVVSSRRLAADGRLLLRTGFSNRDKPYRVAKSGGIRPRISGMRRILNREEFWPALPGCVTQGESMEEHESNLHEAIEGWLLAAEPEMARRAAVGFSKWRYEGG